MIDRVLGVLTAVPFALGTAAAPAPPEGQEVFAFADPEILESSGLAVADGLFVTMNDSGDRGRVFVVDAATGDTVGTTSWSEEPSDLEALAPAGDGAVWVGDIGDNRMVRESVEVLRVPVGRGDREVEPERYELVYPDGAHDAESLLVEPGTGRLVVITKAFFGATAYLAPRTLSAERPNRLTAVGPAPAVATDAAFLPDGRHLVVRGYGDAEVLTWPDLHEVADVELPDQQQGEGIAVDQRGRWFISSEGQFAAVLRVALPATLRAALAPAPAPSPASSPTAPGPTVPAPEPTDGTEQPGESTSEDRWRWIWLAATAALGIAIAARLRRRR